MNYNEGGYGEFHGYKPYKDIDIVFTGIRPGEKLYEELFYDPDHVESTSSDKIYLSKSTEERNSLLPKVEGLLAGSAGGSLTEGELKDEIFALASNGESSQAEPAGRVGRADEKAKNI